MKASRSTRAKNVLAFAASLLVLGVGCGQPATTAVPSPAENIQSAPNGGAAPASVELGETFVLTVGQHRTVQGGLRVTLLAIDDSRCKPGVQCVWAGELSARLKVEGPEETAPSNELSIGTVRVKTAEVSGFRFELKDATETSVTLAITR